MAGPGGRCGGGEWGGAGLRPWRPEPPPQRHGPCPGPAGEWQSGAGVPLPVPQPPGTAGPYLGVQALAPAQEGVLGALLPPGGRGGLLAEPCGDRDGRQRRRGQPPSPGPGPAGAPGTAAAPVPGPCCAVPYLAEAARPRARPGCAPRPGGLRCCLCGAPAGSGQSLPPSSAQGSCWGAGGAPPGCGEPRAAPEGLCLDPLPPRELWLGLPLPRHRFRAAPHRG